MTELEINNKKYRIIDNFSVKSSNNQVTFNSIKIDFENGTFEDIPYKYQEVRLIQNDKKIFTGFVDTVKFSKLTKKNKYKEMIITLLSPLKLATKRFISLIGNYKNEEAILRILQPLIDDGFEVEEINVPDGQITTTFVIETIENAMNVVCSRKNLFWFIDSNKKIYINSIESMFGKEIKKEITEEYEKGLLELQPTISNIDYANIINFKNVRLFYKSSDFDDFPILEIPKVLKNGDIVNFKNPIVIDEDNSRMILNEINEEEIQSLSTYNVLYLVVGSAIARIYIDLNSSSSDYMKYKISSNITFSDSGGQEGSFVLQRDNFFPNLITGFKWNGADNVNLSDFETWQALRYTTLRFMYSPEIDKLKGIISDSGQIEKTIDYNEQWTTEKQLIDYARSLMQQNTNAINEISIIYENDPKLQIGDIVKITRPNFFINGNFAVKSINYTYYNELRQNWQIILKNSDFISSYIDLFRPVEKQESTTKIDTIILSEFLEESIYETHDFS